MDKLEGTCKVHLYHYYAPHHCLSELSIWSHLHTISPLLLHPTSHQSLSPHLLQLQDQNPCTVRLSCLVGSSYTGVTTGALVLSFSTAPNLLSPWLNPQVCPEVPGRPMQGRPLRNPL